jgi:hypothetical protein
MQYMQRHVVQAPLRLPVTILLFYGYDACNGNRDQNVNLFCERHEDQGVRSHEHLDPWKTFSPWCCCNITMAYVSVKRTNRSPPNVRTLLRVVQTRCFFVPLSWVRLCCETELLGNGGSSGDKFAYCRQLTGKGTPLMLC